MANSNTLKYGENVMRLSRLIVGWYEDMNNGRNFVQFNMKITVQIYSDIDRAIAYKFMVKFNATLRDMVGVISRDKFFTTVATLVQSELTALVYGMG